MDWHERIDGEPGTAPKPSVKGLGVEVEAVLRLLPVVSVVVESLQPP